MNNMAGGGLIDRAFLCGSHDPARYYKKYPRITWAPKGGYEIQSTPSEIAAVISQVRSYLRGHRMLCIGTETLGAERFIAENCGILEMDYIGDALPKNVLGLQDSNVKVTVAKGMVGDYDLITVFGQQPINLELLGNHSKIGTFIIFLGISVAGNGAAPAARSGWLAARKKYMSMLQTGGADYETGVGVVRVLFLPEGKNPNPTLVMPQEADPEPLGEEVERDAVEGLEPAGLAPETPKRRGRPPRAQNA